ncbi:unnamed protein product [Urochloa humidicola]
MSTSGEHEKDAAAAAAEGDEKVESKGSDSGWELLYCGGTSFDSMGRKVVGGAQGNLVSPTRLRPLVGVDIRFGGSGCSEFPASLSAFEMMCARASFLAGGDYGRSWNLLVLRNV